MKKLANYLKVVSLRYRKMCPIIHKKIMLIACLSIESLNIIFLELQVRQNMTENIQLFRERLSEKVHATIPKGIVGGFEFSVLQRNLKELARKALEMCFLVLKESNKSKFGS